MNYKQLINNCAKINHWLFSSQCVLCTAPVKTSKGLCSACFDALPWHNAPQCQQCGLLSNHPICGQCLKSAPEFDVTVAALRYAFPLDALMQQFKYGSTLQTAHLFADLISAHHAMQNLDLIIPMPLHPKRLKERGFNQSLEIAKLLAKQQNIPIDYHCCARTKYTAPQASLPLKERVKNIKGAFACHIDLTGKRIAIIDDVMTTGASLNELAKTLKKAGAAHVECWVVARTLPHD
ncbi:MAG: ComF family protein [Methylophilaceae bacterium]